MSLLYDRMRDRVRIPHLRTSMGDPNSPDYYPPTTSIDIAAAEQAIELSLPPLLHQLYTHIGNGGFGPGWGILGVEGRPHAYTWGASYPREPLGLIGVYRQWRRWNAWPVQLVPICDWGCSHWSCLDCSHTDTPVVLYLATRGEVRLQSSSFASWMEAWLDAVNLWEVGLTGQTYVQLHDTEDDV